MPHRQLVRNDIYFVNNNYENYIKTQIKPDLWLRFEETMGNPVSIGRLNLSITQTACTQSQDGVFRTNEAYDFNGATSNASIVSITNNSTLGNYGNQKWAFLLKPDTLGASNAGRLFSWGAGGSSEHQLNMVSLNRLQMTMRASTTAASAITNNQEISDLIGNWCWVFADFDNSNSLGNGRRIRLFKAINGIVTQLTLATDTAMVGTITAQPDELNIGSNRNRTIGLDGKIEEVIASSGLWTLNNMNMLADLFVTEPYKSGTVFVSKSGNDSNVGSFSNPVLTISKANEIASHTSISKVNVANGTYQETVTPPRANLTYEVTGTVIIDGETSRNGFDINYQNVIVDGYRFINCTNQSVWFRVGGSNGIARNCESSFSTSRGFYAQGAQNVQFLNCYSHDHTSGYGFEFEANVSTGADNGICRGCWSTSGQHAFISKKSSNVLFENCVAFNTTASGFYSKAAIGMKVYNCVAYNCVNSIYISDDGAPPYSSNSDIKNTIVQNADIAVYATSDNDAIGLISNYNDFYDCDAIGKIASTTYSTLSNWQVINHDLNSLNLNPNFVSVVYSGFRLPEDSILLVSGENGNSIGLDI